MSDESRTEGVLLFQQLQRRRENNFFPFRVSFRGRMEAVLCNKRFVFAHLFAERKNVDYLKTAFVRFLDHNLIKLHYALVNIAPARIFVAGRRYAKVRNCYEKQTLLIRQNSKHRIQEITKTISKANFIDALHPVVHTHE